VTFPRFRRRSHRSQAGRRPVLDGDFPDDGQDVTELLEKAGPAGQDGTTIAFGGASGAGLDPADVYGAPRDYDATGWGPPDDRPAAPQAHPHGHFTGIGAETTWHPAPGYAERRGIAPPARLPALRAQPRPAASAVRTHSAAGNGWTMTVNTSGPGIPWNDRLRAAHTFLKLKWAYLEQRGMGYRVDEADQVVQRGEELPAGSIIGEAHREAVTHLIGDRGEWEPPGGWNHGWAGNLPWYRPEDGDTGLPLQRPETPQDTRDRTAPGQAAP
jgi:hypothetical protein